MHASVAVTFEKKKNGLAGAVYIKGPVYMEVGDPR